MHNLSLIETLAMNASQALYPIREVSRLTGVNAITLRAWERRYGLIEPVRTESGHRLYTDEHVQLIKRAVQLTQQGVPISQVKSVLEQQAETEHLSQMAEFEELETRLKRALQSLDIVAFQEAVDNLFIELDELSVLHLFARFDQLIKEPEQTIIWDSVLLPRLYSRLRFAQKRIAHGKPVKHILVAASAQMDSQLALVLSALWVVQHGMQPMLSVPAKNLPSLAQVKALQCQGVLLLAESSLQEFAGKSDAIYPSLDCLALLTKPSASEPQVGVQVEQIRFSDLFRSERIL
ncbi:HTH merR-type domain-containing protein [uncultured Thiomicrorhabdus sp.]